MTKPTKMSVRPAKTQVSLGIRPAKTVISEDYDQTGRMPCLRWAHTHFVGSVMSRLI